MAPTVMFSVAATVATLTWERHSVCANSEAARIVYPNGYGASILRGGPGGMFYTRGGTYEIAVLLDDVLCYETDITDDVLGYLSETEADKALADIFALEPIGEVRA